MELDTKFLSELGDNTHMRSQLVGNLVEKNHFKSSTPQPGYGLRENPRKTWRAEDLKTHPLINEEKERICKQCGKGFRSMKALCGHMACHSEKDRFLKDDDSWTSERIEREDESRKRPKRATNIKRKKGSVKSSSVINGSYSSSVSDFEEEEVAMCLIMLSKDNSNFFSFASNQESSDSVVLEAKSSSIDMKIGRQLDGDCDYDINEIRKLGKGKLKSVVYDESSYSKKLKSEGGSGNNVYDTEFGKKLNQDKCRGVELRIGLSKREEFDKYGSDHKIMKFVSKNKKKPNVKDKKKAKAHECPYCNRVFKSGQALGGHKRSHFLGNSVNRNNFITNAFEAETSEVKDLLDLNLPAPDEEEDEESEHSQFVNW